MNLQYHEVRADCNICISVRSVKSYKLINFTFSKDEKYESHSGVIASPNWSNNYKRYHIPFYGFCDQDIELSEEKQVVISVMDLDIHMKDG